MREIKFRAWKASEQRMVSWMELRAMETKGGFAALPDVLAGCYLESVMQFTGLTDRNGTEIYEGDVVEYQYSTGREVFSGIVEYASRPIELGHRDQLFVGFVLRCCPDSDEQYYSTINGLPKYAVIGNIHQNPELLGDTP